jgi:hypothetical protein
MAKNVAAIIRGRIVLPSKKLRIVKAQEGAGLYFKKYNVYSQLRACGRLTGCTFLHI